MIRKNLIKKSTFLVFLSLIIFLINVFCVGCQFTFFDDLLNKNKTDVNKEKQEVIIDGELSFHFLELGNKNNGDCIYVKAGQNDILIDGGSTTSSFNTITAYVDKYCTDNTLEYVIITHADSDHIDNFAGTSKEGTSLFDYYECKTIIDFPLTNKTTKTYDRYVQKRDKEVENGATHYNALQCYKELEGAKRSYSLSDGITLNILYNKYYEEHASSENNYSVCTLFTHGDRNFLFTGDLEKEGEESLVENNILPENVELFKAGHHGSYTASTDKLLKEIKPKIVVVSCSMGYNEYRADFNNVFPSQDFIDRVSKYTDKVYVTTLGDERYIIEESKDFEPFNGTVIVNSNTEGVSVICTNKDTLLKDSTWFKENRKVPVYWQ